MDISSFLHALVLLFVSFQLLFPLNKYIPLDRRLSGLLGAGICYSIDLLSTGGSKNIGSFIDVSVLLTLVSIMSIYHVLLMQPKISDGLQHLQRIIKDKDNGTKGFWSVGLVSFLVSPLITNDGLCLFFVKPVLDALKEKYQRETNINTRNNVKSAMDAQYTRVTSTETDDAMNLDPTQNIIRQHPDFFFYMVAICSSSNIGSAFTYIGNPQNIIVASYSQNILSGGSFSLFLLIPSIVCFLLNMLTLDYFRKKEIREWLNEVELNGEEIEEATSGEGIQLAEEVDGKVRNEEDSDIIVATNNRSADEFVATIHGAKENMMNNPFIFQWVVYPVVSFVFISPLLWKTQLCQVYAMGALVTVCTPLILNHCMTMYNVSNSQEVTPARFRPHQIAIDELFRSLDVNLIIIFSSLFIVSGYFLSTSIPLSVFTFMAGQRPFASSWSIFLISICVSVLSQGLGNVPCVIMIANILTGSTANTSNIKTQKLSWVILAWVSTLAGNLTLTGSAANLIVAEQAEKYEDEKVRVKIDAIKHWRVCGWVSLLTISFGIVIIMIEFSL